MRYILESAKTIDENGNIIPATKFEYNRMTFAEDKNQPIYNDWWEAYKVRCQVLEIFGHMSLHIYIRIKEIE